MKVGKYYINIGNKLLYRLVEISDEELLFEFGEDINELTTETRWSLRLMSAFREVSNVELILFYN